MNKLDSHDSRKTTRPLLDPNHPDHKLYTGRVKKLVGSAILAGLAVFGAEKMFGNDSLPAVDGTSISVVDIYAGSNERSTPALIDEKGDGSTNVIGSVPEGQVIRITNPVEATALVNKGYVTMIGAKLPGSTDYVWFDESDLIGQGKAQVIATGNSANTSNGLAETKIDNNLYMFKNSDGKFEQASTAEILPAN